MVYLAMRNGTLTHDRLRSFDSFKEYLSAQYEPLIHSCLASAAKVLGVAPETLRSMRGRRTEFLPDGGVPLDGEVFADGKDLLVVTIMDGRPRFPNSFGGKASPRGKREQKYTLRVSAISSVYEPRSLEYAVKGAKEIFGVTLSPYAYGSSRFDELKAEGRESPSAPSEAELAAAQLLGDRTVRSLAIAIKSSGGLLVRDLPKQLPPDDRTRVDELAESLRTHRIIHSEMVVVCTQTQTQVTRAPTRDLLQELSQKGVKCACGRPIAQERIEEVLTITDSGRLLLDKARWLTLLLVEKLCTLGISRDAILLDQTVGGDEIDCLANISGELSMFELKDKEFSLGNAYSFGAKIGIIQPHHPVIVTTEKVGNDAKEHFGRARLAGKQRDRSVPFNYSGDLIFAADEERKTGEIIYIEGVDNLGSQLEALVSRIYQQDAARILDRVIPLGALRGHAILHCLHGSGTKPGDKKPGAII